METAVFSSSCQNTNGKLWNLLPILRLQWQRTLRFTARRHTPVTDVNIDVTFHIQSFQVSEVHGSDGLAPPQPRSLKPRKRECPSDEISQADDVETSLHQQDTEENKTTEVATLLQCSQSPLQECAMITNQQDQAVRQSCFTKQDDSREEKHAEAANVYLKNVMVKASERQEETTVPSSCDDSELEGCRVHTDNDTNKHGTEEITQHEGIRSPSQSVGDQLQVFSPTSEEGDGSCATALEKRLDAKENSQCNFERNHESSQEEPCNMYTADVKEVVKEAAAGLPAKKKRRMGMCGLTERERSHFLQTQKRENGQNGAERVEKQICNNNTADPVAQEEITSTPVHHITGQSEAEIKLQSSHCGRDDRAETEVHIAATTSAETSTMCDPGCSEEKSCGAKGDTNPGPKQSGEPKSDPLAQEEVEEQLGSWERQENEGSTTEIMTTAPEKQSKDKEERSAEADCSPALSFYTNQTKNEDTEKKEDGSKTASLQVDDETKTRAEQKEEIGFGADDGAEVEGTSSTGFNCGSVKLCDTAVTPSGSERKEKCDPEDEPGPSTVKAKHSETKDTADPFDSGCLDDVSDSQLNTIVLIEEELMGRCEDPGSSDCHEDATDLICGLIRELSSLNRKVMATHRELENLRRGSKTSRSSLR
ncbi:uncharacterized protein LOC108875657 isoform X1 [Lates calcarifer]|uniref:Uncharacterized protein LOC108875657 isoform X1 n=1 Tax=Lates calcarifer TaxID=8187 RepID=A0AAJ7LEK0_LATCA|nr:uncharacterized protein LOC108875657 isoform X1 [Lates calcarifer]